MTPRNQLPEGDEVVIRKTSEDGLNECPPLRSGETMTGVAQNAVSFGRQIFDVTCPFWNGSVREPSGHSIGLCTKSRTGRCCLHNTVWKPEDSKEGIVKVKKPPQKRFVLEIE